TRRQFDVEPARPRAARNDARACRLHRNPFSAAPLPYSQSESFHWRNLALAHNPASFFFANHCRAKVCNFSIDLLEGVLRELFRWREVFLEFPYVLLRAFDLIRRQRAKDSLHRFDFRNAMAKHHYIVPGLETQANGFVQSISDQNRAHVEIVSHDQAFETKFVAQQLRNNSARHADRRGLRLKARIPPVADHHAVYGAARHARRSRPTN